MPWVFIDDKLHENDKLMAASGDAVKLWLAVLSWVNDKMSDGHIPAARARALGAFVRSPDNAITELVKRRLWHHADRPCKACVASRKDKGVTDAIPDGGYYIHDYFVYQRARWAIVAERSKRSTAASTAATARWAARDASTDTSTHAPADASTHAPSDASTDASRHAPVPRTPVPPYLGHEMTRTPARTGAIAPEPDVPDDAPGTRSVDLDGGTTGPAGRVAGLHQIGNGDAVQLRRMAVGD